MGRTLARSIGKDATNPKIGNEERSREHCPGPSARTPQILKLEMRNDPENIGPAHRQSLKVVLPGGGKRKKRKKRPSKAFHTNCTTKRFFARGGKKEGEKKKKKKKK